MSKRLFLLIGVLVLLSGLGVYTWTLPARREKALSTAPINDLIALSKKEPNNARVFYHLGLRLQSVGQMHPARASFERSCELDDEGEDACLAWSSAASALGNEAEAFAAITVYLKNHPNSAKAHKALASFYFSQEALPRAVEEAQTVTRLTPKDGSAWRILGASEMGLEKFVEAQNAYQEAARLDPKDWRSLLGVGDALSRLDKKSDALSWYVKANTIAPEESLTSVGVGRIQLQLASSPADTTRAREMLERAVSQDPGLPKSFVWLARAYIRERDLKKAEKALAEARRLTPYDYEVPFEMRRIYMMRGDQARAARETKRHEELQEYTLQTYNLLTQLHEVKGEQDRELRLRLARLYASHGDYAKAYREYKQLVRRAPDLLEAQKEMAVVQEQLSHSDLSELRSNLPIAPASVSTGNLLKDGEAMLSQKRYEEAQNAFLAALQREPRLARASEGAGLALEGLGKDSDSFQFLIQALKIDPTLERAQFTVSKMYYNANLKDESARRMEKLVQQFPDNAEYQEKLGICYLNTNRAQKAEAAFTRAASLAPQNAIYWRDLADAQVKTEKAGEAEAHYRKALQLAPADTFSQVRLATLLLNYRATPARQQEAESFFQTALSSDARNADALLGLGRLAVIQKKPSEAIKHLEALIALKPDFAQPYYELAKAYELQGNKERAAYCRTTFRTISTYNDMLENTEELVRLHLKDANLRLKLARLYSKGGHFERAINTYQVCLTLDSNNAAARKELEDLTARLKASGQMPAIENFNTMVRSALATR